MRGFGQPEVARIKLGIGSHECFEFDIVFAGYERGGFTSFMVVFSRQPGELVAGAVSAAQRRKRIQTAGEHRLRTSNYGG